MKFPKLKFKKIKEFFRGLPRVLVKQSFFTLMGLIVIALIFGGIVFYKYSFLVEKIEPEVVEEPLRFKEKTYQQVLDILQERDKRFKEADLKEYPDPFRPTPVKKRLPEERAQELLALPFIQELLRATNLYEFYAAKGEKLLLIEERAQIWEELGLGKAEEYQGTYSQNIRLLEELKKELTE